MAKNKDKRKNKGKDKAHNPDTCFRCRLSSLILELYPEGTNRNDDNFIVVSLGEMTGIFLSKGDDSVAKNYIMFILKEIYNHKMNMKDYKSPTKH
jgi:hypothetical protein